MEAVLSYLFIALSDISFMLAMLVIVLVSACFLGRYIKITRKMVIATCGVLIFQIVFLVGMEIILKIRFPEAYEILDNMSNTDMMTEGDSLYDLVKTFSDMASLLLNGGVFIYAFIFYLLAYKEKRLFRATESLICLWLYYQYINNMTLYTYLYFRGGKFELFDEIYFNVGGIENIIIQDVMIGSAFIISVVLFLILYFVYFKKKRFYVVRVRDRILFVVWLVIFVYFPSLPMYYSEMPGRYKMLSYVFGALLPVLGGLAPIILVMTVAEKNLREKNEYQETYLTAELEYIEQYKRTQTETRAFRHDIINNLSLTNMMLDEGKVEEASQHLKELLGNVRALSPSIITGDEMLDCIVSMKVDKMKEIGLDYSLDGVIDGGLHMKPMDVCSIFANALDNAIEAASKCMDTESEKVSQKESEKESGITAGENKAPRVDLKIKRTEKFFIVRISNSAKEKVDVEKLFMSSGYTSKNDKEHHGFGLRNIRDSVEKYDGLVKAESDDNTFALSVMIPRK